MTENHTDIFSSECLRLSSTGKERVDYEDEEMKELFKDPAFCRQCSHCGRNAGHDRTASETSTQNPITVPSVAEKDVEFSSLYGKNLITRRITIAGGFLDIALFTANCEQLKFVLELGRFHIYYKEVLALIITSLILQLCVGLTMFLLGYPLIQKASDEAYITTLNHLTMGLVALITIVNIFIGTFGPKGTVMARCLGSFAYPSSSGMIWKAYLNATRNYMDPHYANFSAFLNSYS